MDYYNMKVREIHCKRWFLSSKIGAITLLPFGIYYNTNHWQYKEDFEALQYHEMVHVDQIKREGLLRFYITYVLGDHKEDEEEAYRKEDEYKQQR